MSHGMHIMKIDRRIGLPALFALTLASGVAIAGGCLQGTWSYRDAGGRVVGGETVGCGELDGAWGTVTANASFNQGCASSF